MRKLNLLASNGFCCDHGLFASRTRHRGQLCFGPSKAETGSGVYEEGTQVWISAHRPADGMVFDRWVGGDVDDVFYTPTFIIMPPPTRK